MERRSLYFKIYHLALQIWRDCWFQFEWIVLCVNWTEIEKTDSNLTHEDVVQIENIVLVSYPHICVLTRQNHLSFFANFENNNKISKTEIIVLHWLLQSDWITSSWYLANFCFLFFYQNDFFSHCVCWISFKWLCVLYGERRINCVLWQKMHPMWYHNLQCRRVHWCVSAIVW